MKIILKTFGAVVAVALAAIVVIAATFIMRSGAFKDRGPEQVTACTAIDGQGRSGEDILIDRERNVALVSWLDRRGQIAGNPTPGTVGKIDLSMPEPTITPATVADPPDFRTHGMSLYVGPEGQRVLFVISHPIAKPHRVEIFEANPDGLYEHKQTIEDPLLVRPNDIAAVGPRQFYIANDSGARNGFDRMREFVFGAALADITYYDGAGFSVAYHGVASAGGINVSPDGGTLFVAETGGGAVSAFRRDAASGALARLGTVTLGSAPDNIDIADDGSLWVTAHANTLALAQQFGDASKVSPTQVFRVGFANGWDVRQVFYSAGSIISAGSVAATAGNKMLLGSITDRKIMLCEKPE